MQPSGWQDTIEHAVKAIVSIRFSQVASFDTEGAETSEASGFIVDAERGLILTNRHVVCSGPFVGEAIAHDHEEVDVHAVYRDPVHDFGFLKFDPSKIRYMPVTAIPLRPDLARVGLDIRVVGNDAGEKLSILAGSVSRLDRNAPEYGDMTYNDFNTFYLQAASSTSGGSSGSPVIDINGNAVALQAGGHTKAATDFFLPLDRVVRALEFIQRGETVPRGTIQVQFLHRPFDETRRLGLRTETEAMVRAASSTEIGMLVVETVVPKGPGALLLEEGDILVRINGQVTTKFVPLEEAFDQNVDQEIVLELERGGEPMSVTVRVQNLHAITPDRYVEVGGAKVNELSYQLARSYCVPARGVFVAEPAGMFRLDGPDNGWIVASVDSQPTPTLDDFVRVMRGIPDRERVPVVYYTIADVHMTSVAVVQVDHHWSRFRMAVRNDITGLWDFTDLGAPLPPKPLSSATARFVELDASLGSAKELISSLVKVTFYMPIKIDGFPRSRKQGAGLVVDAERGLIVVGRNIVPFALGDLSITFADSIVIPGKVEFLHPTHNVTFISYDPKLIGGTPVKSACLSDTMLTQGHKVTLLAFNHNYRPVCLTTVVTDVTCVTIPQNATPRFRGINLDAITLDTPLAQQCSSGVLADSEGRVQGLWLSYLGERTTNGHDNEYHLGLQISAILPVLEPLRAQLRPRIRVLSVELVPVQMVQARHMGVTDEWVRRVEEANPSRHQLFMIRRVETDSPASQTLRDLDLVLAVNGKVVTRTYEMDIKGDDEELELAMEMTVRVPTTLINGEGTDRIICWAGAIIQEPHKAVLQQSKTLPSRVYISARSRGSPSYMYGMVPTMWITQVNGKPTPDLDAFLSAVRVCPDNEYVRVKTISFDMIPMVLSIKQNLHYWPTSELVRDPSADCGWRSVDI
ncbi:trypsin-like cysteine/serine peptidase domain-containing protein [Thamnocephalis sphaerospora]|uniref:Trypsin-like cysteine/serine peptidase domain-containing protein n=1 Tax=Thamnocephalis sphaerospora TaxID=78915 RepID=A0A4P9XIW1_9FUNG|nr:trypsin-like cysteine/serine peptidase domain-containing protein [Thamnocephalis sphaerospora]|eukprot:RKP05648.1 trypsin-like cysteine/serine peptidase domain-containing protein [Thamnocephalis sphaerospora]